MRGVWVDLYVLQATWPLLFSGACRLIHNSNVHGSCNEAHNCCRRKPDSVLGYTCQQHVMTSYDWAKHMLSCWLLNYRMMLASFAGWLYVEHTLAVLRVSC